MASANRRPEPLEFRRAIICALPREFDAVEALFDKHYNNFPTNKHRGDPNFYRTGRIGTDYIVLTCLAEIGKGTAASAASTLRISFPNIDFALVVGICGGVPFPTTNTELILGDVIISHQVVKFDFGRQYPDRFEQKGSIFDTLDRSHKDIRCLLSGLQTRREQEQFQEMHTRYLQILEEANPIWRYPGVDRDQLFAPSCQHVHPRASKPDNDCDRVGCPREELITRQRLTLQGRPKHLIHIGPIASGDTVMESATHRHILAREKGIVGFEMEGAGVCNSISCLIIKGACDYADSHKNKIWQDYAAASGAACAKALLEYISEFKIEYGAYIYSHTLQGHTGGMSANIISRSTTDSYDPNQYIQSAEESLRRLEGSIPSAVMRRVLIPAASDLIERSRSEIRNLRGTRTACSKTRETMFGTIVFETQITKHQIILDDEEKSRTKRKTTFIFHPARWLLWLGVRYGLKTMATNHNSTWRYTIQPVRAVPDDSLIFSFCERGNVDAVRELFTRRQASVYDVDTEGWTPLHTAVYWGHYELAKFLIFEGADKRANSYDSRTPAEWIRCRDSTSRPLDLLLLFQDCIEFNDHDSEGWPVLAGFDRYARPSPEAVRECLLFFLQIYRARAPSESHSLYVWDALGRAYMARDDMSIRTILHFQPCSENYLSYSNNALRAAIQARMFYCYDNPLVREHLNDRGIDLFKEFDGETPALKLMRFASVFLAWRSILEDHLQRPCSCVLFEQETSSNAPLALQGWESGTLEYMFEIGASIQLVNTYLEGHPDFGDISCVEEDCFVSEPAYRSYDNRSIVEPWWEELKHRIRTRKCICFMRGLIVDKRRPEFFTHTADCQERFIVSTVDSKTDDNYSYYSDYGDNISSNTTSDTDHKRGHPAELSPRFEYYYTKYGGLHHKYAPKEYYCFSCLAQREDWKLEGAAVKHEAPGGGGFVAEIEDDTQMADESDSGDDPASEEEFESSTHERKRKREDITGAGFDQLRVKRAREQGPAGASVVEES